MTARRLADAANPLDKPKNSGSCFRQKVRGREEISIFPQDSTDFAKAYPPCKGWENNKKPLRMQNTTVQTVKEVSEVSEGRSPPIVHPKPAACTVVSEPLRSKGFLSPFAARGALGS